MASIEDSPGRARGGVAALAIAASRDAYDDDSNYVDPETPTVATVPMQGGSPGDLSAMSASSVFNLGALRADDDSVDSNFDPEVPTIMTGGTYDELCTIELPALGKKKKDGTRPDHAGDADNKSILKKRPSGKQLAMLQEEMDSPWVKATLESERYDAATIRAEFRRYRTVLPKPDKLLQEQHSFTLLRRRIEESGIELPRFLQYKFEGGIKPHHALCCLLLSDYQAEETRKKSEWKTTTCCPSWAYVLSCGKLHSQLNDPAEFIRDQFYRVAHAVPTNVVTPDDLRKKIRNRGLPVPNYFLAPEDEKQFPPHIALLVILQDGEEESGKFRNILYRLAFSSFAITALLLRVVLEVIGGAGAIWGGAEVFALRTPENAGLWRRISVAVGLFCFLRFLTLNAPQLEDEGDILGPAGPWSLRLPVRLRAVCNHPFHYFARAMPPSSPSRKHG